LHHNPGTCVFALSKTAINPHTPQGHLPVHISLFPKVLLSDRIFPARDWKRLKEMTVTDHHSLRLNIYYCSNCLDGAEFDRMAREEGDIEYTVISLPCSGKADLLYLLKAFETGADGLALVTCPKNECRHLEGNLRAAKRVEEANRLLEETGLGPERIAVMHMNSAGIGEIVAKLAAFRENIRSLIAVRGRAGE
jgi:F420-non-reducing hydrogenase iron-sulfur subunit